MEEGSDRHIPVVGLTAGAMTSERDRSLESGMDDFLTKPIEFEKLQSCLRRFLPQVEGASQSLRNEPVRKPEKDLHFERESFVSMIDDYSHIETGVAKIQAEWETLLPELYSDMMG